MSTNDDNEPKRSAVDIGVDTSTTIGGGAVFHNDNDEEELQRRYEEAMRRWEERRNVSSSVSSSTEVVPRQVSMSADDTMDANWNTPYMMGMMENESNDAGRKCHTTTTTALPSRKNAKVSPPRRISKTKTIDNDYPNSRIRQRRTIRYDTTTTTVRRRLVDDDVPRRWYEIESQYEPYNYNDDDDGNQNNNDDDVVDDDVTSYTEYDDRKYDKHIPRRLSNPSFCRWKTYQSTSILYPPMVVHDNVSHRRCRPSVIIHFCGGTFFGSYPRQFYGTLLEDIARKCNAVVVATSIPIVLPGVSTLTNSVKRWMVVDDSTDYDDEYGGTRGWADRRRRRRNNGRLIKTKNPLDHLALAEQVQTEFNNAYRDRILNEYCLDYDNDKEIEEFMTNVPIVGIGHSLGARIQVVSCTDPKISKQCLAMGKRNRLIRSGRDGMIYLGFANWYAKSSIPGVESLEGAVRKSKSSRRPREEPQDRGGDGIGRQDDVWGGRLRRRQRDSTNDGIRGRSGSYDQYDRYDAEDLDLRDVFGDVVSTVAKSVKGIGVALTPEAEELEFSPTPNELWDALSTSDGWYGRNCRNTLIIQFDNDPIDQGSRLARTLLSAYHAEMNTTTSSSSTGEGDDTRKVNSQHCVKFARLPGGHLTPVTLREDITKLIPKQAVSLLSSTYNFLLEQIDGQTRKSDQKQQQRNIVAVADTVASYIRSLTSDA